MYDMQEGVGWDYIIPLEVYIHQNKYLLAAKGTLWCFWWILLTLEYCLGPRLRCLLPLSSVVVN